jgi:hypothetical protein
MRTPTMLACQQCKMPLSGLDAKWFKGKAICRACLKQQFRKAN